MPVSAQPRHTERLAAALVARFELSSAVRILNRAGILPMPLKGVLLQHTVYRDPADRLISDADMLVPEGRLPAALGALRQAGYTVLPTGRTGAATYSPEQRLELDIHGRLFPRGLFRLRSRQLFARGTVDEEMLDGVVVLPTPLDLYAHLVGNFAKGRHGPPDLPQIRDFSAIASRFHLPPSSIARHLEEHGLARAARYALPYAVDTGDAHAADVLSHLEADRVGRVTAQMARGLRRRFDSASLGSLLAPHLVNHSLPRGAASAASHLAVGLRTRLATRMGPQRPTRRTVAHGDS